MSVRVTKDRSLVVSRKKSRTTHTLIILRCEIDRLFSQHFLLWIKQKRKRVVTMRIPMRKEVENLVNLYLDNKMGIRTLSEKLDEICTPKEKYLAMKRALENL